MYTIDIDGRNLVLSETHVSFANRELAIDAIKALKVIRTDTYVSGAWVNGTRIINIRDANRTLSIDLSRAFPTRDELDRQFAQAFEAIWSVIGLRLVAELVRKLANGETVGIGGVRVDRDGVWVDGSWSFLWWKAPPKLVAWSDLRTFSSDGRLLFESISDARYRSQVTFNDTENAIVLDAAVRSLLQDNNWKGLREPRT